MAILYGTTGDGTTLPVLVDQFGNLLAKGIEGPPGPEGPPGIGQLPPDPYEGAILGWEDGELAWLGGSVPLPAGTYGPYTYIPGDERLDVPQDASGLVNGQQLYMSDFYGKEVSVNTTTDTIANVAGQSVTAPSVDIGDINNVISPSKVDPYNGSNDNLYAGSDNGGTLRATFSVPLSGRLKVWANFAGANRSGSISGDGGATTIASPTFQDGLRKEYDLGTVSNLTFVELTGTSTITFWGFVLDNKNVIAGATFTLTFPSATNFDKFKVGYVVQNSGEILAINAGATPPTMRLDGGAWLGADGSGDPNGQTDVTKSISGAGSVFLGADGAILLRENNKEWIDDFYVTAPEQRIAARKVASAAIRRKKA